MLALVQPLRLADEGMHQQRTRDVTGLKIGDGAVRIMKIAFGRGAPGRANCDAFDDIHGGLVRRRMFASTEAASLDTLSDWPGLRSVLAAESIRSVNMRPARLRLRSAISSRAVLTTQLPWVRRFARTGQ